MQDFSKYHTVAKTRLDKNADEDDDDVAGVFKVSISDNFFEALHCT
jgi:hypothetical protein